MNNEQLSSHARFTIEAMLLGAGIKSGNRLEVERSLEAIEEPSDLVEIINASDPFSMTPLHYACQIGNLEIVTILLKKGALPSVIEE